jgi:autotransporter-associated beta strand protein
MPSLGLSLTLNRPQGASASKYITLNVPSGQTWVNANSYSGAKGIKVTGGGTLSLAIANTFTGGVLVVDGSTIRNDVAGSIGPGKVILQNGTFLTYGSNTNEINIPAGCAGKINSASGLNLSGSITGGGTLTIDPAILYVQMLGNNSAFRGTFVAAKPATYATPFVRYMATNNTSGLTSYNFSGGNASANGGVGGGIRFTTNGIYAMGSIQGSAPIYTASGAAGYVQLRIGDKNENTTYSGSFYDGPSSYSRILLQKVGTGTLSLSGASGYGGGTFIDQGAISIFNASALGTGGIIINSGGSLNLNGIAIANAITVNAGGILNLNGATLATSPTNNGGTIKP